MKTYVIKLERFDDVISTRDKISWAKVPRVLLVWPRRARILRSRLDLVLLDRFCKQMGSQLALVTRDTAVIENAEELGIPTFHSSEMAQKTIWRRPYHLRKSQKLRNSAEASDLIELQEAVKEQEVSLTELPFVVRLFSFLVGVVAFFSILAFLIPSAQITLARPEQVQELIFSVRASPDIEAVNLTGGIPAKSLSLIVEGNDSIDTSGELTIPSSQAKGEVEFTNLTELEQVIPSGTIVLRMTEPVIRFETIDQVIVPAGIGETELAAVQAVQPGSQGNVAAGEIAAIEGQLGLQLLAFNPEPVDGGADRAGRSPTEADYELLRDNIILELEKRAVEEMEPMMDKGQVLLKESVLFSEVLEESALPEIGVPSDQLTMDLQAEITALYVLEQDVASVAGMVLDANLPAGFSAVPGSIEIEWLGAPVLSVSEAEWEIQVSRTIRKNLSEDEVIRLVQGREYAEAVHLIQSNISLEEPPVVRVTPAWWPRLPYFPMRISVELE